jgi:tetratricopeptide (TPR) repeat protein
VLRASDHARRRRATYQIQILEDVLKLLEAKRGRRHQDTQMAVANLGVNYMDAGRLKEAIPLLEEAYHAAKTIPEEGRIRLSEALDRLVQLYEAMDKKDEAAQWRNKWEAARAEKRWSKISRH